MKRIACDHLCGFGAHVWTLPSRYPRRALQTMTRHRIPLYSVRQVLQKAVIGAGLCGLAEFGFFALFEIVHVEIAVGFEPVFVGFDGEGSDEASACV